VPTDYTIDYTQDRERVKQSFGVHGDHVTLGQLLKMIGVIGSGGEARHYLSLHTVLVNGEPEQRRGRKLRPGDTVVAVGAPPVLLVLGDEAAE
jgi:ribosome-associated protein